LNQGTAVLDLLKKKIMDARRVPGRHTSPPWVGGRGIVDKGSTGAAAKRDPFTGRSLEKPLLNLHGATDLESFWRAVRQVMTAAIPSSLVGLTLQHNPIFPMFSRWTCAIADGLFNAKPIRDYLEAHPQSKLVLISNVFPVRSKLLKSDFYRRYMAPHKCPYAAGMFFWNGSRLIGVIAVMRTERQGDLTSIQMDLLQHLHAQFQTALRRLGAQERERSARMAFEEFLNRLPLPTMLLRWDLKLVYQNQAGREFCALWERGPDLAPLMKVSAPIPTEILQCCRTLKERWQNPGRLNAPQPGLKPETVHHPQWANLRATVTLKELLASGVARPGFLVECEELRRVSGLPSQARPSQLSHLVRLTQREQQVTRLLCEGRSNHEIAESTGTSLATVKKHLYSIFRKLEVTSRSRLMALMR
jgi:DNA-binding CsgD family transcriptional regulator